MRTWTIDTVMGRTKFTTSGAHDVIAITSPQKNNLCTEELRDRATVLQSKRANFVVFKVFCCIQESIQEGSILSLWEGTTSTCTTLWEVTCCHVT